ncbi:Uncharacterized protein XB16_0572 [Leptospira santarosai]|uniref:Uncharacterized protein n=1 Tax=Leptospira santarosai TaxID=28183 RepID=A0A2P1QPU4_9LEPT|nr:Uncharacterized protein XB16_0572 [Leptospira santarosai]
MNFLFQAYALNINDLISKYDPKVTKGTFRIVTGTHWKIRQSKNAGN